MPFLNVRHVTTYRYKQPVGFGEHRVMFRPRDSFDQRLLHASLRIDPEPASLHWVHDVFGNCVAVACFEGVATRLRFESSIEIEHEARHMLDFTIARHAEHYPFSYDPDDLPDLLRSMERQYPDRDHLLTAWAAAFAKSAGPLRTTDLLARVNQAIHRDFTYVRREEMGLQPPLQTLKSRSGSCRDFALLMMEALRALGFATRFVSGYLYVPARDGQRRGGGSTHAWVQVYVPGGGWMEFDPTNGIAGNRDLIRVAIARDPAHAVPLWGTFTGFPADSLGLTVEVDVTASAQPMAASNVANSHERQPAAASRAPTPAAIRKE